MTTQTVSEYIVLLAKQMHEKNITSSHVEIPFYGGLVEKKENSFHKVFDPVTLQRDSNSKDRN